MTTTIHEPGFNAPIKTWLPVEEIETGALEQLYNAAKHPEVGPVVAAMPDTHVGYGVTIGCVFPTVKSIIPNAVGVDIGCGMCAINTGIQYDRERMDKNFWRAWSGNVARNVPTGFTWHKDARDLGALDQALRATELQQIIKDKAAFQLGTLGGGNHFLEAQVDKNNNIWLMVHSGSRHTGLRIANYYHQKAVTITHQRALAVGDDLSSLPLDDQLGQDYLHDMAWATDFALESRKHMLDALLLALHTSLALDGMAAAIPAPVETLINIHHNFAALEEHAGQQVMVHRKGATSAFDGQLGIIPGSMGTNSYIVRGRGNEESLKSCSHGAGRRMGRKAAQRAITEADFAASLEGTYSKPSMTYVDEAPLAYKDISVVIGRQADLVDIVHTLKPIITVKGDSRAKED
jgi:tRNA-splicing ligase RtcB